MFRGFGLDPTVEGVIVSVQVHCPEVSSSQPYVALGPAVPLLTVIDRERARVPVGHSVPCVMHDVILARNLSAHRRIDLGLMREPAIVRQYWDHRVLETGLRVPHATVCGYGNAGFQR